MHEGPVLPSAAVFSSAAVCTTVDAVAQPGVGANYSLQFWLPSGHDQEFIARGAFSNYLWTDTARGFTVAQFGTPPPRDALSTAEHAAAMRAIGDALTD